MARATITVSTFNLNCLMSGNDLTHNYQASVTLEFYHGLIERGIKGLGADRVIIL